MEHSEFFRAVARLHAGADVGDHMVVVDRAARGWITVAVGERGHPIVEFRFAADEQGTLLYERLHSRATRGLTLAIGSALYWNRFALCVRATYPPGEVAPEAVEWAARVINVFRRIVLGSVDYNNGGEQGNWVRTLSVSKAERREFMRAVSDALPDSVDTVDGVSIAPHPDGLLLVMFTGSNSLAVEVAATGACGRHLPVLRANKDLIARQLGCDLVWTGKRSFLRADCPFPPFRWDRIDERARDWAVATAGDLRRHVLAPLRAAAHSGVDVSVWLAQTDPTGSAEENPARARVVPEAAGAPPAPAPSTTSLPGRAEEVRDSSPRPEEDRVRPEVLCAICRNPVRNGLIRHQRCERARRDAPAGRSQEPASDTLGRAVADGVHPSDTQDTAGRTADYRSRVEALEVKGVADRTMSKQVRRRRYALARTLVLEQCLAQNGGHCENPHCANPSFRESSRTGEPILDVDHVDDHAAGGADHPANMIALCPNCHAVKTRGTRREELREVFRSVAGERHERALRA